MPRRGPTRTLVRHGVTYTPRMISLWISHACPMGGT